MTQIKKTDLVEVVSEPQERLKRTVAMLQYLWRVYILEGCRQGVARHLVCNRAGFAVYSNHTPTRW